MTILPDNYARCEGIRSIGTCQKCLRKKQYDIDRKRTDIFRMSYIQPQKAAYENKCGFLLRTNKVNKYQRHVRGKTAEGNNSDGILIDVYDVLKSFNVTCPATQHAIKKMLMAGERGHKDKQTDLDEAMQSLQRAKELA